jgi:hypothetical protein
MGTHAGECFEQRGFAGAGRTDDGHELSSRDVQAKVAQEHAAAAFESKAIDAQVRGGGCGRGLGLEIHVVSAGLFGESQGFLERAQVLGFVDLDQSGDECAFPEGVVFRPVKVQESVAQLMAGVFGEAVASGEDVGWDGALFGDFFKLGTLVGGEVFVLIEHVVADGGGLGFAAQDAFDGGDIAAAEPDVVGAKEVESRAVFGDEIIAAEIVEWDDVARGTGAAGEGDGEAAEIVDGGVGFGFKCDPVTAIPGAAIDFAGEEELGGAAAARVEHVGGADVCDVDGAIGQTFDDDGAGKRDDDVNGSTQFGRKDSGESFSFGEHRVGVLVGFEGDDEGRGSVLGDGAIWAGENEEREEYVSC